jgi:hypothetical protein
MREVLYNRIEVPIPILILLSVLMVFYDSVFFKLFKQTYKIFDFDMVAYSESIPLT